MVMITVGLLLVAAFVVAVLAESYLRRRRASHRAQMEALVRGRPWKEVTAAQAASLPVAPRRAGDSEFFDAARHSPFDALARLQSGDVDGARQALQKLAYVVHAQRKDRPDVVRQFTSLMCKFVRIDPLFWRGMAAIEPVVGGSPGIRQTALYSHMAMTVDEARYVLYFAAETGHLTRTKKGNSYLVYLPHQVPGVEAPENAAQPKRRRRRKAQQQEQARR